MLSFLGRLEWCCCSDGAAAVLAGEVIRHSVEGCVERFKGAVVEFDGEVNVINPCLFVAVGET